MPDTKLIALFEELTTSELVMKEFYTRIPDEWKADLNALMNANTLLQEKLRQAGHISQTERRARS